MRILKNDNVLVLRGKDKGKRGRVRRVYPDKELVVVDTVNMIKRHSKARAAVRQAGIIELEAPIHVSNVKLICNRCNQPTRASSRLLEGKKVRVCPSCSEVID